MQIIALFCKNDRLELWRNKFNLSVIHYFNIILNLIGRKFNIKIPYAETTTVRPC